MNCNSHYIEPNEYFWPISGDVGDFNVDTGAMLLPSYPLAHINLHINFNHQTGPSWFTYILSFIIIFMSNIEAISLYHKQGNSVARDLPPTGLFGPNLGHSLRT